MGIEELYKLFAENYKVVKDTRVDVSNALYFSLKGESFNGNQYALEALEKGANYAVIDEPQYRVDERFILVEDVLSCLQELARFHRRQLNIPIIALTGSNGKTTTKELIGKVMNQSFNCYATQGNLNNHIGVPLTLLSMRPEHDFGLVEMGANHLEEIAALCQIALPDYGYITNFGRVHLEGFGSFEGVVQGKTEMYRYLAENGGKVFVNSDDPIQMKRSQGMDRILLGDDKEVDFSVSFVKADPYVSIEFEGIEVQSQLIGNYNFTNIRAAVGIGRYFGVKKDLIKTAVEGFIPDNNRSQIIQKNGNKIILDAYNANPNSMEAAINNLKSLSDENKVAILGDMFEIGKDSLMEHQRIVNMAAESGFSKIFLIGKNFAGTEIGDDRVSSFSTFEEFTTAFPKHHRDPGATYLIKASRGMALERVLDYL